MTIFQAGTGPHILAQPLNSGVSISAANVDTAWVTNSIQIGNTSALAELMPFSTDWTDGWIHFEYHGVTANNTSRVIVVVRNSAGVDKFRLRGATSAVTAQWFDGTTWQDINSWAHATGRYQIDIHINASASGSIDVYWDRSNVASATGNFSSMGSMHQMAFGNIRSASVESAYISQILVSDYNTLFAKVKQTLLTAIGANSSWTGAVSDINEEVPDTATFITTSTPNNIETFTAAARSLTGYAVKAVIVQYSALKGGAGAPTQIKAVLRRSGTNYMGAAQTLTYGLSYLNTVFTTDPSTGSAWTASDAGAATLEFGVQAIA